MADFFSMHGYGFYVWTAYIAFFLVLLIDALGPPRLRRRTLTELRGRLKRETAKSGQTTRTEP